MVDINQITDLLYNKLNLNIDHSELISESYLLTIDELDSELLPTNFYDVMNHKSYRVIFFYYDDIIVYIFYNLMLSPAFYYGSIFHIARC